MTPDVAEAAAAQRAGRPEEAARLLDAILAAEPGNIAACHLAGALALERGDTETAEALSRRVLEAEPDVAEAATVLGFALLGREAADDAIVAFQRALDLRPDDALSLSGLAGALRMRGDAETAAILYERVLAAMPDDARAHSNLGITLQQNGDLERARRHLDRAVALDPDLAEAHKNRAMLQLLIGELGPGFDEFVWRWRENKAYNRPRPFTLPSWDGTDLAAQSLLVWGEQGIGDEIMFASLLPEIVAEARSCTVECAPRLVPLFARSFPDAKVVARRDPPHPATTASDLTAQSAAGDLCRWRRRSISDFPASEPYLLADKARADALRASYDAKGKRLVGIAWASRTPHWGKIKSAPLDRWGRILALPDTIFVSLQYGDRDAEIDAAREHFGADIRVDPTVDQMADLDAFAAQIAAMDAVVAVSGTAAHMAGALGTPCHVLLATMPDWRWQLAGPWSLWYPRQRLYRQRAAGDWRAPIATAAAAVERLPIPDP